MPRLTQRQSISRWPTTTCELADLLILPTDLLAYASRQPGDGMRTAGSPHTGRRARVSGQLLPVLYGVLRILLLPCTVAYVQLSSVGDSYVCGHILCKPRNLGLDGWSRPFRAQPWFRGPQNAEPQQILLRRERRPHTFARKIAWAVGWGGWGARGDGTVMLALMNV